MEKKRIKILIDGQTYNVISDEDELHVLKVAEAVDKQIQSIKKKAGGLSPTMVAVLSAMNLSDELIKAKEADLKSEVVLEKESMIASLEERIEKMSVEIKSQKERNQQSDDQILFLQRKLTERQETIESLKASAEDQSVEQALEEQVALLEKSLTDQKSLNAQLNEKLQLAEDDTEEKALAERISMLEGNLAGQRAQNQHLQEQLRLAEDNSEAQALSEQLADQRAQNQHLQEQLRLAADDTEVQALSNQVTVLENDLETLREQNLDLESQLDGARELNRQLEEVQLRATEQLALFEAMPEPKVDDDQVIELKVRLNEQERQIDAYDEKIFYLQRKLTDKEEELQSAKRELEDFINEFEK